MIPHQATPFLNMLAQASLVLLQRHFALKESSPFNLIFDSLGQSAFYLLQEFVHHSPGPIIYLSYETTSAPEYATAFLDCSKSSLEEIVKFIESCVSSASPAKKALVIIDSLNYVPAEGITQLVSSLVLPKATIIGCYHNNVPEPFSAGYPSASVVLRYISQAIFEVSPETIGDEEEYQQQLSLLLFLPGRGLNLHRFKLHLENRRKLGKSLLYDFIVDSKTHVYEQYVAAETEDDVNEEEMLKELTTFNLSTNAKQRFAREKVDLPFMEAQTEMGKMGGAIVYEFEKDDDYDEEDPYEDPF